MPGIESLTAAPLNWSERQFVKGDRLMFTQMIEIQRANERAGKHFFEPATMRFFRSRIMPTVYGGRYFITSEQFDWNAPRLYTIREVKPNGDIDTVGEFQQYDTLDKAKRAAKKLAAA